VLRAWSAPDQEQEALRVAYLRHLDAHADGVWRSCHPDHLTASSLVVDPSRRRVLLTLHRRIGRWLQTGGHCEPHDATLSAAALREATEESGIGDLAIDPVPVLLSRHVVPCGPLRPAHHLDVQYVTLAAPDATPRCGQESDDVAWFALDGLPADADQSVRGLVRHAAARLS
jgi:8-oxo-dGTP pyrophosphatase MutT (NUDIX family)